MLIARISRGRSVREFVIGVVIAPTVLGFIWFSVFGGTALWSQLFGHVDLVAALGNGYETVLFTMFDSLPFPLLLASVALVLLMIFFVTSADSAVLVLASMSTDEAGDPPLKRKLAWGIAVALIAAALLLAGGLGEAGRIDGQLSLERPLQADGALAIVFGIGAWLA